MSKPRIWISNANPKTGDLVRVRALIEHRMESGLRLDQDGKEIARNIINLFETRLDDELLFSWEPETAISQNPYIEFTFVARRSGEIHMKWVDDTEQITTGNISLTVEA